MYIYYIFYSINKLVLKINRPQTFFDFQILFNDFIISRSDVVNIYEALAFHMKVSL